MQQDLYLARGWIQELHDLALHSKSNKQSAGPRLPSILAHVAGLHKLVSQHLVSYVEALDDSQDTQDQTAPVSTLHDRLLQWQQNAAAAGISLSSTGGRQSGLGAAGAAASCNGRLGMRQQQHTQQVHPQQCWPHTLLLATAGGQSSPVPSTAGHGQRHLTSDSPAPVPPTQPTATLLHGSSSSSRSCPHCKQPQPAWACQRLSTSSWRAL
jgi:hypothetical protein